MHDSTLTYNFLGNVSFYYKYKQSFLIFNFNLSNMEKMAKESVILLLKVHIWGLGLAKSICTMFTVKTQH